MHFRLGEFGDTEQLFSKNNSQGLMRRSSLYRKINIELIETKY